MTSYERTTIKKKVLKRKLHKLLKRVESLPKREMLRPSDLIRLQLRLIKEIKILERKRHALDKRTKRDERQLILNYIDLFRTVGDAIAWQLFPPFWIRQQCKHLNHGGGRGLIYNDDFDTEIYAAWALAKNHEFVVLNELTNCLNISDLTIWSPDNLPKTVEVKYVHEAMTDKSKARLNKQMQRGEGLYSLFEKGTIEQPQLDATFQGYSEDTILAKTKIEQPRTSEKEDFVDELEVLLKSTLTDGKERFYTHDNITGYLIQKVDEENIKRTSTQAPGTLHPNLKEFIQRGPGPYTFIDLYERGLEYPHLPPVSLLFTPRVAANILFGDLIVLIVLNVGEMQSYLKDRNIEVGVSEDDNFLRTKLYKINGVLSYLGYPLAHVLYGLHSTEFLANYCLDSYESAETFKKQQLENNPEAKLIEFDYRLKNDGEVEIFEKESA